jgi:Na+/phosphate symporter
MGEALNAMVAEYPVLEGYVDDIRKSINEEIEAERIALQQTLAKKNSLIKEKNKYITELEDALVAERKRTADLMQEKTATFKKALEKMTQKKNEEIAELHAKVDAREQFIKQSKNGVIFKQLKENNLLLMGSVAELSKRLEKEEQNNNVLAREGDRVHRLWVSQGELIAHLENQVNDLRKALYERGGNDVLLSQQVRTIELEARVNDLNADLQQEKSNAELLSKLVRILQNELTDEQIKKIHANY